MAHLVALRCPNCNGFVSLAQSKCEYCGAEYVVSQTGGGLSLKSKSELRCPNCNMQCEEASWFCGSCGTLLTKDVNTIEMLKNLQRRNRFNQDEARKSLPIWMQQRLEPDEYIYLTVKTGANDFYTVTDKRIIKNKGKKYEEANLNDVASMSDVHSKDSWGGYYYQFTVKTYQGTLEIGGFDSKNSQLCYNLHRAVETALNNHTLRKKDARALVMKLQLGQPEMPPLPPTPPPPPSCSTCGGPLRYIVQYKRWYCDREKKYT